MRRADLSKLEMAVETVEIQERYTKKAVRALQQEEFNMALHLKAMGEKLEALMGEIKDDREQRKQWAARRESGRRRKAYMECHLCHQKGHFARECPTNTEGRSGNGGVGHGRKLASTSLDGSGGTGSAYWSIRDQLCPSWRHGHGGNGVARRTS